MLPEDVPLTAIQDGTGIVYFNMAKADRYGGKSRDVVVSPEEVNRNCSE